MKLLNSKEAAHELGVNTSRVVQLLLAGRIRGARKIGRDWIIPSPIKVKPGSRGPAMRFERGKHDKEG